MTNTSDKIFVTGATGYIGSKLIGFLLEKNAKVTAYVRNIEKAKSMFPQAPENLKFIQGDYTTTDVFEREIIGHTRLFFVVAVDSPMADIKGTFAKIAYDAGVRQIVDISSSSVNSPYRYSFVSSMHREGEDRIIAAKKRKDQYCVIIRPGRFYTNHLWIEAQNIKEKQQLSTLNDFDKKEGYVSNTDIAELCSVILTDPIEKHDNCVYTMFSQMLSIRDRAAALSDVLGKNITVNNSSEQEMYDGLIHRGYPHHLAINFVQLHEDGNVNPYYAAMLGRPAQTFRDWLLVEEHLAQLR
ncbi:NAD(P)-binding protein [Backusella circina FSU 941]|nr:NAD(P)-binding protein [Backusella circina FSU 941]